MNERERVSLAKHNLERERVLLGVAQNQELEADRAWQHAQSWVENKERHVAQAWAELAVAEAALRKSQSSSAPAPAAQTVLDATALGAASIAKPPSS